MKLRFSVLAFSVCLLSAQTPDLSGVWKADLSKSKISGPKPTEYLMVIDQKESRITGKVGVTGEHGQERSSFNLNTQRPSLNYFRGIPMRTKTSWEGNTLVVDEHVGGAHPMDVQEKYALSSDGNTLSLDQNAKMGERQMASTIVFEKQPASAAEALNKPEQTAGEHFKNVTVLKEIPASQLIDDMRYFTFSLGVDCEFCHVRGNFSADDKRTKTTARHMIEMTENIDKTAFHGHEVVRCYTCHQGHQEPIRVPE